MMSLRRFRFATLFASLAIAFTFVATDFADARRGGSFGSRGFRTFQATPPTRTAPTQTAPVQRTMTPNPGQQNPAAAARAPGARTARSGLFSGFRGSLLGGLMLGGLFGLLLGTGFGGIGFFGLIFQILLIALAAMFLIRLFRSRQAPAYAGGHSAPNHGMHREAHSPHPAGGSSFRIPGIGSAAGAKAHMSNGDEIGIAQSDLDRFEQMLEQVQAAFTREDYGALRRLTTPEVMSYLAQELSENATSGRRNEVRDVKLLQGDVAEAWSEGSHDYATVAMRYSSIDVMRDRETGAVIGGSDETPTETTELWTFVRENGSDWTLSAIQEA